MAMHKCTEAELRVCLTLLFPYQFSGISLTLNGVSYTNNSIVTITEIGTGSAALNCITTNEEAHCCFSAYGGANGWFFPNGSEVKNNANLSYYRTRARDPGTVLLHHNREGTTTGIFRCDIPATRISDIQSLYVGIYSSTTGESCMLRGWLVICKEIYSTPAKENIIISSICVYPQLYIIHVCCSIPPELSTIVVLP